MTRLNYAAQQHKFRRNGSNGSLGPTVALPLNFNGSTDLLGSGRESTFSSNAAQCHSSSHRAVFMASVNHNRVQTGPQGSPRYDSSNWQMTGKHSSDSNIVERLAAANACRTFARGEASLGNFITVNPSAQSSSTFQMPAGMAHAPWLQFPQHYDTFDGRDSYSALRPAAGAAMDFNADRHLTGPFSAARERTFPSHWKSMRNPNHSRSPKRVGGENSASSLWQLMQTAPENAKVITSSTGHSTPSRGIFKNDGKMPRQTSIQEGNGAFGGQEVISSKNHPGGGIQWLFDAAAAAAATAAYRAYRPTGIHSFPHLGQHGALPMGVTSQPWSSRQHQTTDLSPNGSTTNVSVAAEAPEDIPSPRTAPARGGTRTAAGDAMSPLSLPATSSMRYEAGLSGDRRGESLMPLGMYGSQSIGKRVGVAGRSNSEWDFCSPADTIEEDYLFRHDELHRRRNPRYLARTRRLHDLHIVIPISIPSGRVRVDDIFGANFYEFEDKKAGVHVLFGRGVSTDSNSTKSSESPKRAVSNKGASLEDLKPACDVWASFLNIRLGTIYNLHLDQIPLVVDMFRSSFDNDLCHFYVPISMDCHGVYPSSDELISQRALRPVLLLRESRDGKRFATERYETRAVPTTENDVKRLRMIRRHVQFFATRFVEAFGVPATPPTAADPSSPFAYRGGSGSTSFVGNVPPYLSAPYFSTSGGPLRQSGSFRLLPPDPIPQPCIELHENCRTQTITRGALKLVIREWSPLDDPDLFKQVWHGRLAAGSNGGSPSVVNDFKSKLLENRSIPTARILLGEVRLEHDHLRMVDPRWPDELVLGRRVADGYPSYPAAPDGESSEARFVFCKRIPKPEIVYAYAEPKVAEDDTNKVIVDPRDEALSCKLSALFKIHLAKYPTAGVRIISKDALQNLPVLSEEDGLPVSGEGVGRKADAVVELGQEAVEARCNSITDASYLANCHLRGGDIIESEDLGSASKPRLESGTTGEPAFSDGDNTTTSPVSRLPPAETNDDANGLAPAVNGVGGTSANINGLSVTAGATGEVKDPEAPLFEPHGQEELDGSMPGSAIPPQAVSEPDRVQTDDAVPVVDINEADSASHGDDTESFTSAAEGTSPVLPTEQGSSVPGMVGGGAKREGSESESEKEASGDFDGDSRFQVQPQSEPPSAQRISSLDDLKKIPDPFVPLTTLAKMQASGLVGFRASSMDDFSLRRKLLRIPGAGSSSSSNVNLNSNNDTCDLVPAVQRLLSHSMGRQRPTTVPLSVSAVSDRSALLDPSGEQTLPITTATCKFFLSGGCARGNGCYFLHPADPRLESKADVRHIVPQHPKFF